MPKITSVGSKKLDSWDMIYDLGKASDRKEFMDAFANGEEDNE